MLVVKKFLGWVVVKMILVSSTCQEYLFLVPDQVLDFGTRSGTCFWYPIGYHFTILKDDYLLPRRPDLEGGFVYPIECLYYVPDGVQKLVYPPYF